MALPTDLNPSDDELAFIAYLLHAFVHRHAVALSISPKQQQLMDVIDKAVGASVRRTFGLVRSEGLALWDYVTAYYLDTMDPNGIASFPADAFNDSIKMLQTFPLDLLDWPVSNAFRNDVTLNPMVPGCITRAVDYDELFIASEWNYNPRTLAISFSM